MKEYIYKNRRHIVYTAVVIGFLFFCYIFYKYIFTLIAPFFFGWLISLLVSPIADRLNKKLNAPMWLGSFIGLFVILGVLMTLSIWGAARLIKEMQLLYAEFPTYIENIKIFVADINEKIKSLSNILPDGIEGFFDTTNADLMEIIAIIVKNTEAAGTSIQFVLKIPNALVVIIIALISSFFFAKDKQIIKANINNLIPSPIKNDLSMLKRDLGGAILGYVKAQLILMVITFVICIIGLPIINSSYWLLLSVIISIIDALPFFGSGFILWPGAIIYLLSGKTFTAVGYIIIYLIITLERQFMQPKVLSDQIGLHPIITLMSMYIGLRLIGVIGMIVGPILAVIVKAFIRLRKQANKQAKTAE